MNKFKGKFAILCGLIAATILIFVGSYILGYHLCLKESENIDELEWLKKEFNLSSSELNKIRELHEGYRPVCQQMCAEIAEKKAKLAVMLENSTNVTPEVENLLVDINVYRARCQANMLRHFYEVSRQMPPEQGKRYLKKMKEFTLGAHEHIEQTMSGNSNDSSHKHY